MVGCDSRKATIPPDVGQPVAHCSRAITPNQFVATKCLEYKGVVAVNDQPGRSFFRNAWQKLDIVRITLASGILMEIHVIKDSLIRYA
jgi:hypothetical protein